MSVLSHACVGNDPGNAKPTFPYVNGATFKLVPNHVAKPSYVTRSLNDNDRGERDSMSLLDRCLKHPFPDSAESPGQLDITIVEQIRAEDGHMSQLLRVRPNIAGLPQDAPYKPPESDQIVAKIYDPLYADHEQDDVDIFRSLEVDYTHESVAYRLLSRLYDHLIPRYYGSYALTLPVDGAKASRQVRVVLMSYVAGKSMMIIDPNRKPQVWRKQIMAAIVAAEAQMYFNRVWHRDVHPRNIIVPETTDDNGNGLIRMIDFGMVILNMPSDEDEENWSWPFPDQYIPPHLRFVWADWSGTLMRDFSGWIDWEWDKQLRSDFESQHQSVPKEIKDYYKIG